MAENVTVHQLYPRWLTRHEKGEICRLVDVRNADEWAAGHIEGATLLPLPLLPLKLAELDKEQPLYVICRSGMRSQQAVQLLEKSGFSSLHNVSGGMMAWEQAGYPVSRQ